MSNPPANKYAFFLLISTLFCVHCAFAQSNEFQNLVRSIEAIEAQDEPPTDSLWALSQPYFSAKSDTIKARINLLWGRHYFSEFQFDSAKHFMEEAIGFYAKAPGRRRDLATSLIYLGHLSYDIEDISSAISAYHRALAIYEELGMQAEAGNAYNGIGNSYCYIAEFNLSLENYQKSMELYSTIGDSTGVSKVLGNIANLYTVRKDYDKSLEYYEKALKWSVNNARQRMDHILGIGIIKEETKEYDGAEAYYREAVSLGKEVKDYIQLAYTYQNLAFLYVNTDQLDSVPKYMELTRELAEKYAIGNLHNNLNEINHQYLFKKGLYKEAYELLKEVRAKSDSFYNLDMTRQLQEVEAQYSTLKKQKELAQKDLELERASGELGRKEFQRNILIVGLLFVMVLVVMIYRSRRLKDRANNILKQKNQQIEEKNKEIKSMEEAKSRWFINISHELRTPLTLIKGPIRQALGAIPTNDHIYKDLKIADRNVGQLQKLVDEILDLSKMEDGKMPVNLGRTNLTELVLNALASFDSAARHTKVKLEFELDPQDPVVISADREKINNVLTNLISNALKFTHEGGKITVGLQVSEEGVALFVRDTGDGIPADDLDKIFDRFYQSTHSGGGLGGTGVGLAFCKEIARMHGGDLSVTSELGVGSRFELFLPGQRLSGTDEMAQEEEALQLATPDIHEEPAQYRSVLKDKKILVVEDNADMRAYISGFLSRDFEVIEARDGMEGLEKLRAHTPDLIVSDVMMPRMDGLTFAREVKKHPTWKNIPFITVSAIGDETEKVNTLRIGIDDYLVKPFFAEELRVRVQNLIYNYSERITSQAEPQEEEISHEEKTLKKLEKEVYDNIDDSNFNVIRLAEAASMSERQLYRYIREMTGLTPANFIKEIRLQRAMDLIQKKVYKRTSQLSYAVGFPQPAYFSTVFKKRFGRLPAEYIED